MSFNPEQCKGMIQLVLSRMGAKCARPEAVDIMMLTAAKESDFGTHMKQLGSGPALGMFQVEPATMRDNYDNFLNSFRRAEMRNVVNAFSTRAGTLIDLAYNPLFGCAHARLKYWRSPTGPLPRREQFKDEYLYMRALAEIWNKYYNANAEHGTVGEALAAYDRYCR